MTLSANSPPSIRVNDHGFPFPGHRRHPSVPQPSNAMAIPNARQHDAPPPLEPPRHIGNLINGGEDLGWKFANGAIPSHSPFGDKRSGFSLSYGQTHGRNSVSRSLQELSLNHRDESDEDSLFRRESRSLESGGPNFSRTKLPKFADMAKRSDYDRHMISKINGLNPATLNTPTQTAHPRLSVSTQEPTISRTSSPRLPASAQEPPVSPFRRHSEAPSDTWRPRPSPLSPLSALRSPGASECESASQPYFHHRGSYDHVFSDVDYGAEDTAMRDSFHRGRSPAGSDEIQPASKAGQKRRASSPPSEFPREERLPGTGYGDLYHRRSTQTLVPTASPMQRRGTGNPDSLPSAYSSLSKRASLSSSFNFSAASSMTSYNGDQLLSPGAQSLSAEAEGSISPYPASRSLDPSPRASLSYRSGQAEHEQQFPSRMMSSENMQFVRQGSISGQLPTPRLCECCPKKPKKFDTLAELRAHESEKQYSCQYCPNRFKNKNEAERHQNSLHIRQFSWSCAALMDPRAAFHPASPAVPSATDLCGYCGQEFTNPPNWEVRKEHLNVNHKYGECNKTKKFYRADHFRQHLKHTHAGASGKWTNQLENACMQNEEPPSKGQSLLGVIGSSVAAISLAPKPGTIPEAFNES